MIKAFCLSELKLQSCPAGDFACHLEKTPKNAPEALAEFVSIGIYEN